ncbi:hypothetical protein [Euzebya rosea]|uniref:hypothetical protein n=1 Tax=Euzebya rosea TaxID=2052804 RepID=UPI000D3E4EEE|nr:hypothetical protein [Euzebya rosea]
MSGVPDGLDLLEQIASRNGVMLTDGWGETVVRWMVDGFDSDDVADAQAVGLVVSVALDGLPRRLQIDDGEPDADDLDAVLALLSVASDRTEAESSASRRELVGVVSDRVVEIEVAVRRRGWARTRDALIDAVVSRPAQVLEDVKAVGSVACGSESVAVADVRRHDGDPQGWLWELAGMIDDAAGWQDVSAARRRDGDVVLLALRRDADPSIRLGIDAAVSGGRRLADWVIATDDPNRLEALRFVLTQVTVGSPGSMSLPAADGVRELAERYRIALAQENAAAVAAAAAASHETALAALTDARRAVDAEVSSALKGAGAVIGAVVAAASLIVRNTTVFPDGAIAVVVIVLVTVEVAMFIGAWSRIDDGLDALERRRERIRRDPLLPEEDRQRALASADAGEVSRRALVARASAGLLTLLTCGAVIYVGVGVAAVN